MSEGDADGVDDVVIDSTSWIVARNKKNAVRCFVSSLTRSLSLSLSLLSSIARSRDRERVMGSIKAVAVMMALYCLRWCMMMSVDRRRMSVGQ